MSNSRLRIRLSQTVERLASDVRTTTLGGKEFPLPVNYRLEKEQQPIMEWNVHLKGALEPPNWLKIASEWNELLNNELRPLKKQYGAGRPGTLDINLEIDWVEPTSVTAIVYRQLTLNWAGVRLLGLCLDRVTLNIREHSLSVRANANARRRLAGGWLETSYEWE